MRQRASRRSWTAQLEAPDFLKHLQQATPRSDRLWLIALVTGLATTLIPAITTPYPESLAGRAWVYAGLLVRVSCYLWAGDRLSEQGGRLLGRLFALGLVAGLFELVVDWWLVNGITSGRLVYLSGPDVVLLSSPIWMPIAWACVIVELGYPTLRLFSLFRPRLRTAGAAAVASVICGLSAAFTVGFYEYFAYRAGWWKYEPSRAMLGPYCSLYIPLGEGLMFLTLLPIAAYAISEESHPRAASIAAGAQFACAIAVGYAVAYVLLEGWG